MMFCMHFHCAYFSSSQHSHLTCTQLCSNGSCRNQVRKLFYWFITLYSCGYGVDNITIFCVTNIEVVATFCKDALRNFLYNSELCNYMDNLPQNDVFKQLKFNYVTENQFNSCYGSNTNNELSIFQTNIRSLNSKHSQLCQFLELLVLDFDVIVLSEIWSTNISFYSNILPGYYFYYDIPTASAVGGVGIFVKTEISLQEQYTAVQNVKY